jgi:hypothetical protein
MTRVQDWLDRSRLKRVQVVTCARLPGPGAVLGLLLPGAIPVPGATVVPGAMLPGPEAVPGLFLPGAYGVPGTSEEPTALLLELMSD